MESVQASILRLAIFSLFLVCLVFGLVSYDLGFSGHLTHNKKVLAQRIEPTSTPTPSPTPLPTATPTPMQSEPMLGPTTIPTSAPTADQTHDTVWNELAQCESGGNWADNTGNGYYGGLQFNLSAWASVGGSGKPSDASKDEQIMRGKMLETARGWGPWGSCSKQLGLN